MSAHTLKAALAAGALACLVACATPAPDGGAADIQRLTDGKTAGAHGDWAVSASDAQASERQVAELLRGALNAEAAVRIALLNSPVLQGSLAGLGVSDADRAQMGRLQNPHLSIGRFTAGDVTEIERVLRFDVIGLLTLPWKAKWAGQQHELAKLQAAQDVVKLAANTRKAWVNAVAAEQSALYMRDVMEAAQAGAELARRMASVGNWSRLSQAREQVFLADATAQLARAQQHAVATREALTRMLGLWGTQTGFTLPQRLPDLPGVAMQADDLEGRALRERLDVRSAKAEAAFVADQLGYRQVTSLLDGISLGLTHNTTFDNAAQTTEARRGVEIELPLPLIDAGGARDARARAVWRQSTARLREVAVQARSEARESYLAYRTAHDLARHYRDEVVPLRKFINDELVLRYNGMLASVWELLADTRQQVLGINGSIEALRDFWLAETDLQTALTGTSPGALATFAAGKNVSAGASAAH